MSGNAFDVDAEDLRPTYTLDKPIIFDRKPLKSRKPRSNAIKSPFKTPPVKKSPLSRKTPKISVIVESQTQQQQHQSNPPSPLSQYNDSAYDSSCSSIECAPPLFDNSQHVIGSDTNSSGICSSNSIDTPIINKVQSKLYPISVSKKRRVSPTAATPTAPSATTTTAFVTTSIGVNNAKKGPTNAYAGIEKVTNSNTSIASNAIKQRGRKKNFPTPEELPTTDSSTSSSSSSSSSSDLSDTSVSENEDASSSNNSNNIGSVDKLNKKSLITVPTSVKRTRKPVRSNSHNFGSDDDDDDNDQDNADAFNGSNNDVSTKVRGVSNRLNEKNKKNILYKSKAHLKKPTVKRNFKQTKSPLVKLLSTTMAPESMQANTCIVATTAGVSSKGLPSTLVARQPSLTKQQLLKHSLSSPFNSCVVSSSKCAGTAANTNASNYSCHGVSNTDKLTRQSCKTTKAVVRQSKLQNRNSRKFLALKDFSATNSVEYNDNDDNDDDDNDDEDDNSNDDSNNADDCDNDGCDDDDFDGYDSDEVMMSVPVPAKKKLQKVKTLKSKLVKGAANAINATSVAATYNGGDSSNNKEITLAEMLNTYNPMLPTAMRSACVETIFDSLDTSSTRNKILPLAPTAFSFAQNSRQRQQIQKLQKEVVAAQRYYEQCILYVYCDNRLDLLPKLQEENPEFVNVLRITDGNQMIRQACSNICNYDNLLLLEWSEAILIQLCCLNQPDILSLQWFEISRIVATQQWNRILTKFLREVVAGPMMQLQLLLTQNHNWKCTTYQMPDNLCFVSGRIPPVNLFVLQKVSVETKFNTITSTFIPTSILMPCNNDGSDDDTSTDEETDTAAALTTVTTPPTTTTAIITSQANKANAKEYSLHNHINLARSNITTTTTANATYAHLDTSK